MNSYKFQNILRRLIYIGVDPEEQSLAAIKGITTLTRLLLMSILMLFVYTIFMFKIGLYSSSLLCALSSPIMGFNYYLIAKKKIGLAKYMYAGTILFLIAFFSVFFGKGMGSEYWIIIIGGISLLIFRRRENAFIMVIIGVVVLFITEFFQDLFQPIYYVDEAYLSLGLLANVFFIFLTTYGISFILRYSSEDFEKRIQESNSDLVRKNKDLTDSINYSKRIQMAVLPSEQDQKVLERNIFVIFEPKDIVSGDFYWIYRLDDRLLFGVVDGSGHGVSGALISIMVHTLLSQCVEEYNCITPSSITLKLKELIIERKEKWKDQFAEDLEVTLCCHIWKTGEFSYSSNGNVIYLMKHINNLDSSDGFSPVGDDRYAMKEIRNPYSFAKVLLPKAKFLEGAFKFRQDDMVYLATNGFSSQIGGPKGKKLKTKRLKDLLMSVQHFNLKKQRYIINDILVNWKGKKGATDDITLLGFKI